MVPDTTDDLVILSDQEWVMSYPMTPSAWLRTACGIVGRDLTRAEWDRYLPGGSTSRPAPTWTEAARRRPRPGGGGRRLAGGGLSSSS